MSLKVLDVAWFSGRDCIGIIACENEVRERKFYIGVGDGIDKEQDIEKIKNWGSKIDPEYVKHFFKHAGVGVGSWIKST